MTPDNLGTPFPNSQIEVKSDINKQQRIEGLNYCMQFKMFKSLLVFALIGIVSVCCKKLPLYIKPCPKNAHLKECLVANIEAVKPHLKKGVKLLDAPPLDPLVVPLAKFETPTFQFETRDIILRGVGNFTVNDIDLDLDAGLFKISLDFPAVDVETGYSMNGRLFLFNVSGAGFAEGHARDARMTTLLKGSPKHLDDKEYFDFYMEDFKIEMLTNKSSCYFRDLVPGNPEMTDSINALINSRVNDFVYLVEPIFKEVFGGLIANIVKTVFFRYSLDDLFVD